MFWICHRSKQQQMYVWRMTSNGTVLRLNDGHLSVSPVTSKFIWNYVRDYLKLFLEQISGGSVVQYPKGVDVVYFSSHYPLVFFFVLTNFEGNGGITNHIRMFVHLNITRLPKVCLCCRIGHPLPASCDWRLKKEWQAIVNYKQMGSVKTPRAQSVKFGSKIFRAN